MSGAAGFLREIPPLVWLAAVCLFWGIARKLFGTGRRGGPGDAPPPPGRPHVLRYRINMETGRYLWCEEPVEQGEVEGWHVRT